MLTLPVLPELAQIPQTRLATLKPQPSLPALIEVLERMQREVGEALHHADAAGLEAGRQASLSEAVRKRLEHELEEARCKIAELERLERIPRWVRKMFGAA